MNSASRRNWFPLVLSLFAAIVVAATAIAQPPFGRIRAPRPPMVGPARPPMVAAPAEKLEVEGGIVVAFLNLDRSPIGAIVEAKLRGKKIVNWWHRGDTQRLLDDLELSTAIDIPPSNEVRRAPKLPDAIILCRTRVQGRDTVCEIVVCEPSLGLRLGSVQLPLSKRMGSDVGKLADGTVKVLGKLGEEMKELWGVPPLRSKDLGSKYDSLRGELAAVVEEELLRRKGALLVETEYAHAIALTRKHAGIAEPLQRTSPIYLTGQYRNHGEGDQRTLAITLQIAGSEEATTDTLPAAGLPPPAAEQALRERVQAIAKNLGGSQDISNKETAEEISLLANLSNDSQRAGDAAAQLALLETSLLLKPADLESQQESLKLIGKQVRMHWEKGWDVAAFRQVTEKTAEGGMIVKNVPNEEADSQMQEGLLAMNLYRRGLRRVRQLSDVAGDPMPGRAQFPVEFLYAFQAISTRPDIPRAYRNLAQRISLEQRDVVLQHVRREAKQGIADSLLIWGEATASERTQLVLRLIVELQDEPQVEHRTVAYVMNGVYLHILKTPEGEQFLQQLAEIPNPGVQAALVKIKEQVAKYEPPRATPPLPMPAEPEEKDADVRFVPLDLAWKDVSKDRPELKSSCESVLAVGGGADLFCREGQVLLMKRKGESKVLYDAAQGLGYFFKQFGGLGISPAAVCFDGKYAWLPMTAHGRPSRLLVVDVEREKVVELTAESGLPCEVLDKNYAAVLAAAPLGPGKAFLVGSFGKTWMGIATFDGEKGKVKVIHEAQEASLRNVRDQWRNTNIAFSPSYLFAMTDPAGDKEKLARRMIIGRSGGDFEVMSHPLLVDPESGKVTVLETSLNPGTATVLSPHDGSLYWLQTSNSNEKFGGEFMKLGFPDFEPTSLGKQPLPGKGFQFTFGMEDKRVHVFHDQWLTAEGSDQPLQVLKGNLPINERTSPRYLVRSNHYGWVLLVSNFNKGYAVEFKK